MKKKLLKKGVFITVYGVNNIGKSTHVRLLGKRLQEDGYDVEVLKYPRYDVGPTGPLLNKFLRQTASRQSISEQELQMWFTLNRYQCEPFLKKSLARGKIVISEDYIGTGIAWGMAKGVKENWILSLNRYLLPEDFSILLQGRRALRSRETHHIHETNDRLIQKTASIFSRLAKQFGWHILQTEDRKKDTAEKIYKLVKKFLTTR